MENKQGAFSIVLKILKLELGMPEEDMEQPRLKALEKRQKKDFT